MPATIVRYRLKPDRVADNVALVERVFAELAAGAPLGVHYATFQDEDGVGFTHVAVFDSESAQAVLGQTSAFQQFVADIADRCVEPPVAVAQTVVGSYGAFG